MCKWQILSIFILINISVLSTNLYAKSVKVALISNMTCSQKAYSIKRGSKYISATEPMLLMNGDIISVKKPRKDDPFYEVFKNCSITIKYSDGSPNRDQRRVVRKSYTVRIPNSSDSFLKKMINFIADWNMLSHERKHLYEKAARTLSDNDVPMESKALRRKYNQARSGLSKLSQKERKKIGEYGLPNEVQTLIKKALKENPPKK